MTSFLKSKATTFTGLISAVGLAAALYAVPLVGGHEGEVLTTYTDPVGVSTVCYGDTDPGMAIPGVTYTREECLRSLERQLIAHAGPVVDCLGIDPERYPAQTAAFVSLAYNIGAGTFCRSTAAKRWRAGDHAGACEAITWWNKAGGRVLKGLVRRRADERALCLQGLGALSR